MISFLRQEDGGASEKHLMTHSTCYVFSSIVYIAKPATGPEYYQQRFCGPVVSTVFTILNLTILNPSLFLKLITNET